MARVKAGRRRHDFEHVDVEREPVVQAVLDLDLRQALPSLQMRDLRQGVHPGVGPPRAADRRVVAEQLPRRARRTPCTVRSVFFCDCQPR